MCNGSKNRLFKLLAQGLATKIPIKILSFSKNYLKKWRKEMSVSKFYGEVYLLSQKVWFPLARNFTFMHLIH
jgi:hypothetical protein